MKKIPFCFLLILLTTISLGQPVQNESYLIRGYVYDSSSTTGLAYASVIIKGHKRYNCMTNENGFFEIKLPSKFRNKNCFIKIAFAGSDPYTMEINNKEEMLNKELAIRLYRHNYSKDSLSFTCCNF